MQGQTSDTFKHAIKAVGAGASEVLSERRRKANKMAFAFLTAAHKEAFQDAHADDEGVEWTIETQQHVSSIFGDLMMMRVTNFSRITAELHRVFDCMTLSKDLIELREVLEKELDTIEEASRRAMTASDLASLRVRNAALVENVMREALELRSEIMYSRSFMKAQKGIELPDAEDSSEREAVEEVILPIKPPPRARYLLDVAVKRVTTVSALRHLTQRPDGSFRGLDSSRRLGSVEPEPSNTPTLARIPDAERADQLAEDVFWSRSTSPYMSTSQSTHIPSPDPSFVRPPTSMRQTSSSMDTACPRDGRLSREEIDDSEKQEQEVFLVEDKKQDPEIAELAELVLLQEQEVEKEEENGDQKEHAEGAPCIKSQEDEARDAQECFDPVGADASLKVNDMLSAERETNKRKLKSRWDRLSQQCEQKPRRLQQTLNQELLHLKRFPVEFRKGLGLEVEASKAEGIDMRLWRALAPSRDACAPILPNWAKAKAEPCLPKPETVQALHRRHTKNLQRDTDLEEVRSTRQQREYSETAPLPNLDFVPILGERKVPLQGHAYSPFGYTNTPRFQHSEMSKDYCTEEGLLKDAPVGCRSARGVRLATGFGARLFTVQDESTSTLNFNRFHRNLNKLSSS
eukprot:TRINITY_DN19763_c0_g1_i2.p1 TRINITY_DN19763_c0_g1~~TRINITY_DN19763_c0_g1_i2.p1  ORF type:complete len:720 (+),score=154.11 TRINITY_DN19763_c0_g1_i2:268-2160(+)